jgi:hypothetical protein
MITLDEIFEIERIYNAELAGRCTELMKQGRIQDGYKVQFGRFAVREFLSRIKVHYNNKKA